MSLHSVYNIVALAAFALGAAALITAAILFVSQRLWEVMSVRHKRPASARRTTGHTAPVRTPPQPTGGRNTSVLNQSTNTANGTRPANDPESFAPGTSVLDRSVNAANGTTLLNSQADVAAGTTLLHSQADVAAGTTLLKAKPTAPPTATGGTVQLKPPTASGGTVQLKPSTAPGGTVQLKPPTAPGGTDQLKPSTASGGTVQLKPSTASGGTVQLKPSTASGGTVQLKHPTATGGTTMLRVTPGAPAARVRCAEDVVSAHVLGAYAASIRPNRSEPPAAFRIVKDEVVVHTSEVI